MIRFFERPYPSANAVLLTGHRPVLVDPGFGADAPALLDWLQAQGTPGAALSLIVNTHWHCDHAGGNHALQRRFGTTVAASADEAGPVNARDPDACQARWLRQPIEAYQVGRVLQEGDQVATGDTVWTVLATPGHSDGHLSLHCPAEGALVLGDALHGADLGWLAPDRAGEDRLRQSEETVERLALLPARVGYSGHGRAILDLDAAFARARRRLRSWREDPERIAWHACKRIFAHALMLADGLAEPALAPMLLACPWFLDHARLVFAVEPAAFVPMLVAEMLRADAAFWDGARPDARLRARAPYRAPPPDWPRTPARPADWPPTRVMPRPRRCV